MDKTTHAVADGWDSLGLGELLPCPELITGLYHLLLYICWLSFQREGGCLGQKMLHCQLLTLHTRGERGMLMMRDSEKLDDLFFI